MRLAALAARSADQSRSVFGNRVDSLDVLGGVPGREAPVEGGLLPSKEYSELILEERVVLRRPVELAGDTPRDDEWLFSHEAWRGIEDCGFKEDEGIGAASWASFSEVEAMRGVGRRDFSALSLPMVGRVF